MRPMANKKKHNPNPSGRKGSPVSLAPLTTEQALAGLLRVTIEDVKKLEAQEKKPRKKKS